MRNYFLQLILILFSINVAYAYDLNSPLGYWKTVDDMSGKIQSIIQITENTDHTLSGTLVKTYAQAGQSTADICTACDGPRHNQLILGMTIMTGLKKSEGEQWKGGEILDPTTGKIYRCAVRVVDNGRKLHVRGYIGLPLLGRSQIWLRSDKID